MSYPQKFTPPPPALKMGHVNKVFRHFTSRILGKNQGKRNIAMFRFQLEKSAKSELNLTHRILIKRHHDYELHTHSKDVYKTMFTIMRHNYDIEE